MFKFLSNTFYYRTFTYIIDLPKETVVEHLDNLFMEKSGLFTAPNLRGKFVDYPDTFYLTQKWWTAQIQNFEREPAILKGVITKVTESKTSIEIAVRPNSVFLIINIGFFPIGCWNLYKAALSKDWYMALGGLWLLVVGLPALYFFAKMCSNKLRRSFEKYMNIIPTKEEKQLLT